LNKGEDNAGDIKICNILKWSVAIVEEKVGLLR
jgi:hypothetical protein